MIPHVFDKGSTDKSVILRVVDSTDGTPETSVAFDTPGVQLWYMREGGAIVDLTEITLGAVNSAHADGGFIHTRNGYCRLDLPDAAYATGADWVIAGGTFTDMIVIGAYVVLTNPVGMTGTSVNSNVTHWLGTAAATPTVNGVPEVDVTHWIGTAAATPTVAGVPEVDLTHVVGATTNVSALATNVNAIKASTDNLPSDPADASVVAGLIAAAEAKVDTLLTRLSSARAGYLDFLNGTVAGRLKKNTAFTNFMIKMELAADGTPGTGLTVTVQRAIDGGAFAALAVTTVTEVSAGWYKFNLAAADLNGESIALKATATGAKQRDLLIITQTAA